MPVGLRRRLRIFSTKKFGVARNLAGEAGTHTCCVCERNAGNTLHHTVPMMGCARTTRRHASHVAQHFTPTPKRHTHTHTHARARASGNLPLFPSTSRLPTRATDPPRYPPELDQHWRRFSPRVYLCHDSRCAGVQRHLHITTAHMRLPWPRHHHHHHHHHHHSTTTLTP